MRSDEISDKITSGDLILVGCSSHRARSRLPERMRLTHAWCFGDALPKYKGGIYVVRPEGWDELSTTKPKGLSKVRKYDLDRVYFGSWMG